MAQVIAKEDVVVHDDNLNIDRRVFAGQPVPPDLVSAYKKEIGEADSSDADASSGAAGSGDADPFVEHVSSSTIKDLLEEVADDDETAQRILDVERGRGNDARSSLVDALEKQLADDGE